MNNIIHQSVMLQETLDYMPDNCKIVVDGTLWHGWHSLEMIKKTNHLVWIDMDNKMLAKAKDRLAEHKDKITLVHGSYTDIPQILEENKLDKADYVIVDLGVNMEHFKDESRGFSIRWEADLDMRFDTTKGDTAYDVINNYGKDDLSNIFQMYADFSVKIADQIAEKILAERKNRPFQTTQEFKNLLNQVGLGDKACSVIFQSIRIETNKEIDNLKLFLDNIPRFLAVWGICGVMTYHSIEDRITKYKFKEMENSGEYKLINKKVIKPHYTEVQKNRAARSAKYRFIQRIT